MIIAIKKWSVRKRGVRYFDPLWYAEEASHAILLDMTSLRKSLWSSWKFPIENLITCQKITLIHFQFVSKGHFDSVSVLRKRMIRNGSKWIFEPIMKVDYWPLGDTIRFPMRNWKVTFLASGSKYLPLVRRELPHIWLVGLILS